jgi:hypothetical protein
MPCAHKVPSQHFLEYVFLSLHKHARVPPPCGDDLDGVFHPFCVLFGLFGLFQLLIFLSMQKVKVKITPIQSQYQFFVVH